MGLLCVLLGANTFWGVGAIGVGAVVACRGRALVVMVVVSQLLVSGDVVVVSPHRVIGVVVVVCQLLVNGVVEVFCHPLVIGVVVVVCHLVQGG